MEEIKKYICKCQSCNSEFDEEEYQITQDENKCILHCNKDNWNINDNTKFFDKFKVYIDKYEKDINNQKDILEKDPYFDYNILMSNDFIEIHFPKIFTSSIFYSDFFRKNSLYFNKCVFYSNQRQVIHNFLNTINFKDCIFKEDVDFSSSKFSKSVNFDGSTFEKKLILENTSFEDNISFKNTKFNEELKIDNTYFNGKVNFHNITLVKEVSNRETARIIKDSFEQQNNIIEANKFYALEMKEREKELKQDRKEGKNFFEWLVFKIHGLSSNHSQDWVLSLFWILSFSFGYSFMSCVNSQLDTKLEYILTDAFIYIFVIYTSILIINYKKMNKFYLTGLFYILYVYLSKDFTLQTFSNNLNPFSIMTEFSELNFSTMIYKITIAYLIYQLIISIRQNTRRK